MLIAPKVQGTRTGTCTFVRTNNHTCRRIHTYARIRTRIHMYAHRKAQTAIHTTPVARAHEDAWRSHICIHAHYLLYSCPQHAANATSWTRHPRLLQERLERPHLARTGGLLQSTHHNQEVDDLKDLLRNHETQRILLGLQHH